MFVKPAAAGLVVRDPFTMTAIPPDGCLVPAIDYWLRRLRDGDVVAAEPPATDVAMHGGDPA